MIKGLYPFAEKWSEKGSIYIISDPHFDDADCWLMDPDWPGPNEYIEKIKKKVTKNDTLICLGDCGDPSYFSQIPGYKVLIMGNHDSGKSKYYMFDEIYEGPLFISPKILLSHEPVFGLEEFCFNVHGHEHNGEPHPQHLNLAANVFGYEPVSLGNLIKQGLTSKTKTIHRFTIDKIGDNKKKYFVFTFGSYFWGYEKILIKAKDEASAVWRFLQKDIQARPLKRPHNFNGTMRKTINDIVSEQGYEIEEIKLERRV